jgi:hypothetical protein
LTRLEIWLLFLSCLGADEPLFGVVVQCGKEMAFCQGESFLAVLFGSFLQTMIFLPEPLLDEPLPGIIARYIRAMGAHQRAVLMHIFGTKTGLSLLGHNLTRVEQITKDCWGLSAIEIAERMTCFPYYAALCSKSRVDHLRTSLLSPVPRRGNSFRTFYMMGSSTLRFCKECFADDLRKGEPKHWRRVHQIRGVCVCPWHGSTLWQVEFPASSYPVPEDISDLPSRKLDLSLSAGQRSACRDLARISYGLLTNRVTVYPESIGKCCENVWLGRIYSGIRLSKRADLVAALEAFFGMGYLRWCRAFQENGKTILQELPNKPGAIWPTFSIVLLATICEALKSCPFDEASSMRIWFDRGVRSSLPAVYCVNPFSAHGPAQIVDHVEFADGLYRARCCCGAKFVFHSYKGRTPQEVRITAYGAGSTAYMQQLMAQGMTLKEIALTTGSSEDWLKRFVSRMRTRRHGNVPSDDVKVDP